MIKEMQYRTLLKEFNKTGEITMSSRKSGMSRKTGSKYLKLGKSPGELRKAHTWRTRKDPFEDVANEINEMLSNAPELEALTIFTYLQEKYPGKFHDGQLRTMERRVKQWRLTEGKPQIVSIPQIHKPGELMELDWTNMNRLKITICGEPFKHLLCHTVLTYSNWEWAEIASSESFLSLKQGFQSALRRLGAVPRILQTDNSSTATHQVKKGEKARDFNHTYKSLLEHYGVKPRSINVNSPDENGDVESANGHLKRRIEQRLLIRGSRDFSSIDEYRDFLHNIIIKANSNRADKVKEELRVMRELPDIFLPEYTEHETTVSSFSTVRVNKVVYSVPTSLKDKKVRLHVYENRIEIHVGRKLFETITRRTGTGYCVDYRHVIESLRRKPGAFANCRYKDQCFPSEIYRVAYERLGERFDDKRADKEYLEILGMAAEHGEDKVSDVLEELIRKKQGFTMDTVKQALDIEIVIPEVERPAPSLLSYDSFLNMARRVICLLIH